MTATLTHPMGSQRREGWTTETQAEALAIANMAAACMAEVGIKVRPIGVLTTNGRWMPRVSAHGLRASTLVDGMARKAWALVGFRLGHERMSCLRHGAAGSHGCLRVPIMSVLLDPLIECGAP